jgi:hypothetical protein
LECDRCLDALYWRVGTAFLGFQRMAFQPRISTLDGANLFWNRYDIAIAEHGRAKHGCAEYIAKFSDGRSLKASSLNALLFALGDFLIAGIPNPDLTPAACAKSGGAF